MMILKLFKIADLTKQRIYLAFFLTALKAFSLGLTGWVDKLAILYLPFVSSPL
jgi:hypothetical protein